MVAPGQTTGRCGRSTPQSAARRQEPHPDTLTTETQCTPQRERERDVIKKQ